MRDKLDVQKEYGVIARGARGFSIPDITFTPLCPDVLEEELDKIRGFELIAKIKFEDSRNEDRACAILLKHGPFVCYGERRYGVSCEKQISALSKAGIHYSNL